MGDRLHRLTGGLLPHASWLVDDSQVDDLDEVVVLKPDSNVSFVKLVPLVGG